MPILLRAALAAAALSLAPLASAAAQTGNQSDVSGPNITGSGGAGGSFLGAGIRVENEMFIGRGGNALFRSARIGCPVRLAAREYLDSVAPLPPERSTLLVDAVLSDPGRSDLVETLARNLSRGLSGESAAEARALAESLAGLFQTPCDCPVSNEAYTEAPRWEAAIRLFNDLVDDAPDAYLAPPPPDLVAVHDALHQVVTRALGARLDER